MEGIVNRYTALAVISAGLSVGVVMASASTPAIGVAMSEGTILVNDAQIPGNATVFSGTTLQTQRSSSQVRLKDGAQLRFESDSRGKIFNDHVDLQQGGAKISDYSANANGLTIRATGGASASVALKGKVIEVAAITGDVRVFNATGGMVANILPGHALDLRRQDGTAVSPSSFVGCPVKSGNNFLITDETSNVTAELRGTKLAAGQHVQVMGSLIPSANPETQIMAVTSVKEVAGPCGSGAGSATVTAMAGSPTGTGSQVGAAVVWPWIIAGAAAATGLALGIYALNGGFNNSCQPTSSQPCPH
jgi:hypothetical protein